MLVLIKGAGDLGSGAAHRLHRAGLQVVMTDLERPAAIRRAVAFSQCIYDGVTTVEGVTARRAGDTEEVRAALDRGEIPVLADPAAAIRDALPFDAVVDAILAKRNTGTRITDAPIVLALGPGFTAGIDCHGVIETKRGHDLGRLITSGTALPNTGIPGDVGGYGEERIIRAPADGSFQPAVRIGQRVEKGQTVACASGVGVRAAIAGVVRGMLPEGFPVYRGMKAGDIDPRGQERYCFTISDKARAIGGGVLEGLLFLERKRRKKNF